MFVKAPNPGSDEVMAGFPSPHGAGHANYSKPRDGYDASSYEISGGDLFRYGDTGTAARFFYCAKASRSERGVGNCHPTVKPLKLMEWLVELICPFGGKVLDPFLGSGSTALAARNSGRRFVGIEKEEEYWSMAVERMRRTGEED